MSQARMAVVGLGVMGTNHVRVLADLDGVELIAVCDANSDASRRAAEKFGLPAYTSYRELIARERLDAVVIAAPTRYHWEIGRCALEHGLHVLVEKPIASDIDEAQDLVVAARTRGQTLMVGHIERFNPAVQELRRRLARHELGRVYRVHTRRCGPFPNRIRDVGVVIDLATHDLDIMAYLLRATPVRLYAETARRINTVYEDMLNALIRYADGIVGVLEVDWLTPTKVRDISVLGERGMFRVDYLSQELTFYENHLAAATTAEMAIVAGVTEGDMTRFAIARGEPLRLELEAFLRAVLGEGSAEPSGEDGMNALRLATQLVAAGERCEPVTLDAFSAVPVG